MCAGSGTCMNKVLPYVDFSLLKDNWKPFIGISNIVVLMAALLQNGMASFHGPFCMWNYGVDEDIAEKYDRKRNKKSEEDNFDAILKLSSRPRQSTINKKGK